MKMKNKRRKVIYCRVTPQEYQAIMEQAKQARTVSEYVRSKLLENVTLSTISETH